MASAQIIQIMPASSESEAASSTPRDNPDEATTSDSSTVSLLERLKCPTRSELSRKCQVEKPKLPTTGSSNKKHKPGAANVTDPKSISPTTRVKEFPGECLSVRGGKLFCTACREELALKKSTIKIYYAHIVVLLASIMLYALSLYYAQNYAGIIRQGLVVDSWFSKNSYWFYRRRYI